MSCDFGFLHVEVQYLWINKYSYDQYHVLFHLEYGRATNVTKEVDGIPIKKEIASFQLGNILSRCKFG